MEYAIAVLDIGKTNKKVVIYDEKLRQIDSVYRSIPAVPFEELEVENAKEIEEWFLKEAGRFGKKYPVKVLSVSTHGATCACVDGKGELSVPVIAYTNEPEESLHDEFYKVAGRPEDLQMTTGTAQVKPLINLGKLLFFARKRFPGEFARTERILMYPQYFGYRLTGKAAADCTFAGCHTYLWDFGKWTWSEVCDKLEIKNLLPETVCRPGDVLGTITPEIAGKTGLSPDTIVTAGIHDSNSSLIPYLVKGEKDFILNSTGTWCVVMHPSEKYGFSGDELGKTVFYNISAREELVKTAIFMGGLEFEKYSSHLKRINGEDAFPGYDKVVIQSVLDGMSDFIIPGIVRGAGQFPDSEPMVIEGDQSFTPEDLDGEILPRFFGDFSYGYAVLNLSLAIQTKVALDRIKAPAGSPIYIEGGFRKNDVYIKLLASLYPDSPVYTTDISEATSFGAAMLGKAAVENVALDSLKDLVEIEMHRVEPDSFSGMDEYVKKFLSIA